MRRNVLVKMMTGAIAASCVLSAAAWAGETSGQENTGKIGSLLQQLTGEGGPLNEYIPEDADVDGLIGDLSQALGEENSELYETLEQAAGLVTNEDGSVDAEKLEALAEMFLTLSDDEALDIGEGETEDFDLGLGDEEEWFAVKNEGVIRESFLEHYSEMQDGGDVAVLSPVFAKSRVLEDGTGLVLGQFTILNFTADGSDLNLLNGASETKLLTLKPDADGNYEVTDIETAEDGEGYTDSVEAMCAEAEMDPDDFFAMQSTVDMAEISNLIDCLSDNPEYERIEYMGELMNEDDLQGKLTEAIFAMFPDLEGLTEDLTEAETE